MIEPIVLLPDMGADASIWRAVAEPLSATYPILIAPVTQAERAEEIASELVSLLPQRFALLAHGLGTVVGLELLRRAEHRVTRVALISAYPLAEPPEQAAERESRIIAAATGRLADAVHDEIGTWGLAPDPAKVSYRQILQKAALALGPDVYRRQSRLMQRRRDQQRTLTGLWQPSVLICGAHDLVTTPKRHEWMAQMIPDADFRVFEEAGHVPMLETPELLLSAITDLMARPLVLR